jgi:hypothetical protein
MFPGTLTRGVALGWIGEHSTALLRHFVSLPGHLVSFHHRLVNLQAANKALFVAFLTLFVANKALFDVRLTLYVANKALFVVFLTLSVPSRGLFVAF